MQGLGHTGWKRLCKCKQGEVCFLSLARQQIVCSDGYLTSSLVVDGIPVRRHNALLDIRTNINNTCQRKGGQSQAKARQPKQHTLVGCPVAAKTTFSDTLYC